MSTLSPKKHQLAAEKRLEELEELKTENAALSPTLDTVLADTRRALQETFPDRGERYFQEIEKAVASSERYFREIEKSVAVLNSFEADMEREIAFKHWSCREREILELALKWFRNIRKNPRYYGQPFERMEAESVADKKSIDLDRQNRGC